MLGLALDYDIFLLGRALAAASCESDNPTRHMVQGMVQHLSFRGHRPATKGESSRLDKSTFGEMSNAKCFRSTHVQRFVCAMD